MIHVTIGIPCSGKSTWAKAYAQEIDALYINSDILREMLTGSYKPGYKDMYFIAMIERLAVLAIANGQDIIVDACHLSEASRKVYEDIASKTGAAIRFHVFSTPLEICFKRNEIRERKVPQSMIGGMHDQFLKNNFVGHNYELHKQYD